MKIKINPFKFKSGFIIILYKYEKIKIILLSLMFETFVK